MKLCARVCLIDDDIYVRDALALGLRQVGYSVATAPGAVAGFDLVERDGADALITDMNMPGTNGAALIAQARATWTELPIIAISGAAMIGARSTVEIAREHGADAALIKPFRIRDIVTLLESLIAAKSARAADVAL
jgi:DNA-binding response OmpR family regulator